MKKQLRGIILAAAVLALTVLLSGRVMAEEYRWSDIAPELEKIGIDGGYVYLEEEGIRFFIPNALQELPVPEEEQEAGLALLFALPGTDAGMSLTRTAGLGTTLSSYRRLLSGNGAESVEEHTANGLPVLTYTTDEGTTVCAFAGENGAILELAFGGDWGKGRYSTIPYAILSSLQAVTVLNWQEREEGGSFVDIKPVESLGLPDPEMKFWLPENYVETAFPEEYRKDGWIGLYVTAEEEALFVMCFAGADALQEDLGSDFAGYTPESLSVIASRNGWEERGELLLNGVQAPVYYDGDSMRVIFFTWNGDSIQFAFRREADEPLSEDERLILSSIQSSLPQLLWSDVLEEYTKEEIGGNVITYNSVGAAHWIPEGFAGEELTEEDFNEGYIGYFTDASGEHAIAVQCFDTGGTTLSEYRSVLTGYGASNIRDVMINGERAIRYDQEASDLTCVSLITYEGYLLETTFYPASDEDFMELAEIEVRSIHLGMYANDEEFTDGEETLDPGPEEEAYDTVTHEKEKYSVRVPDGCGVSFSGTDGLYVYTGGGAGIPYVLIRRYADVDIDAAAYLESVVRPQMEEQYGDALLEAGETKKFRIGSRTLSGILFTYEVSGHEVKCLRLAMDRSGDVISFIAKYLETGKDETEKALEMIIRSFTLLDKENPEEPEEEADETAVPRGLLPAVAPQFPAGVQGEEIPADESLSVVPTEAGAVSLVPYSDPSGYFSARIPEGWEVEVGIRPTGQTDLISYALTVRDPEHRERQVYLNLNMTAGLKSPEAKEWYAANYGKTNLLAQLPVLDAMSAEGFYAALAAPNFGLADFTVLEDLGETEDGKGVFVASARLQETGAEVEGVFSAALDDSFTYEILSSMFDKNSGSIDVAPVTAWSVVFETAGREEFPEWQPVLDEILASICFTDAFLAQREEAWKTLSGSGEYVMESADAVSAVIRDSYSRREADYDIEAQKKSDEELGYERVLDTETGEYLRAETGFFDWYDGTRYQRADDDAAYRNPVSGIIEWK